MIQKCSTCKHGRIIQQDLTKRVCRGAPPQAVVLPDRGSISIQYVWPVVEASDEGCGMYRPSLDTINTGA